MLGYGYDDISALRDMFDGGGAGQAGDEFQGGGILSLLANMLASPYGSQQEDDQLARTIAEQASPRPQLAPDSSMRPQMRPEQTTTGEELMSGDDASLPAYGGREEAFLLPGAFAPSPQNTPSTPRDRDAPSNLPPQAAPLYPRTGGGAMPGSAAPDDANAPSVPGMTVPAVNAGEAETALNMFRRGLVTPESSAYMPLAQRVAERGTPEQIAELRRILEGRGIGTDDGLRGTPRRREMFVEELSRGGNPPRTPGP